MTRLLFFALLAACLCTAFPQGGPIKHCALTIFKNLSGGCTQHASTATKTSYTHCGACTITSQQFPGPVCTAMTTLPDVATVTEIACAPSPTCTVTVTVAQSFGALSSPTCTAYKTTVTKIINKDCEGNPGCAVLTQAGGAGPVVKCGTWVTSATATSFSALCTA